MIVKRIPNISAKDAPMPSIGAGIRQAREECGLTQVELAKMIGFKSPTALCLIEQDKRRVDAKRIYRISGITRVPVQYLFIGWTKLDE